MSLKMSKEIIKKWEENGLLNGLTKMDDNSPILKVFQTINEQKINELPTVGDYEDWFNKKFGCLPFEKYHGVGPDNVAEALSLRKDFPNDKNYDIITFDEYKKLKQR